MAESLDIEGTLYVEVNKIYEEMHCVISNRKFQAFRKLKVSLPPSRVNRQDIPVVEFEIFTGECETKLVKFGLSDLSRILKSSHLEETPNFFSVTVQDNLYMFGASSEAERSSWVKFFRALSKNRERKADAWIATGFLNETSNNLPVEATNRFGNMPSNRAGSKVERISEDLSGMRRSSSLMRRSRKSFLDETPQEQEEREMVASTANPLKENAPTTTTIDTTLLNEEDDDVEETQKFFCCAGQEKIFGLKVDTLVRMMKVCIAFPFVIVVSSLNLSNKYTWLKSITGIRTMNILMYVAPVVYVRFVLAVFDNVAVQRIAIGLYILIYLLPVGYVVFTKLIMATSNSRIEDGTFCFKPARSVRFTQANFYAVFGFIMEWVQHILYVLPLGIVTGEKQTKLSDFPPYLPFAAYFWISVISTFICGLIIVLNTVLRGKLHYRFQSSYFVWFFLFNVGSPMFVTIITILFMSLWCDYTTSPPTLIQDPHIVCYSSEHTVMARAALIAFAIYIIQHTLLPSGTFKETMRDNDLEIMFVPVYLQAHYLLKAIFCGVYVYFYNDNFTRVIVLTIINMSLLMLNNYMKPCSVDWVNLLRDGFFVHATLSGIISLNYLGWPEDSSTKGMVISTLASTVAFSSIAMYVYYKYTARSTEYSIASAFLDLEWQVSRGGLVQPRVLEPLISLTLSTEKEDWEIAKKYIGQLVWLISYPNMRVQFQSAWGLANLALLDDDARLRIHDAGGTKTLFEWYSEMEPIVQLENLAALANLTLSMEVAEDMVHRNKCIPFFVDLVASNQVKHAQFAAIALANIARKEQFREMIRKSGGIQALVSCIMSHDYQKRRHGCRALANMALSSSKEIEQIFESQGLIDRILKMALRKEIETQREVVALIRNLSCHARLRPLLLDRGVMNAVEASSVSMYDEVKRWCEEIRMLLKKELSDGTLDLKALMRREGAKGNIVGDADLETLKSMEPLCGSVEWSTWRSKLEAIFDPIFASVPHVSNSNVSTATDQPVVIYLPQGVSKQDMQRYKDSLAYSIAERPIHGKLNAYYTTSHTVVYTPHAGYTGTDIFTYRMVVGSITSALATIAINVDDHNVQAQQIAAESRGSRFPFTRQNLQNNSNNNLSAMNHNNTASYDHVNRNDDQNEHGSGIDLEKGDHKNNKPSLSPNLRRNNSNTNNNGKNKNNASRSSGIEMEMTSLNSTGNSPTPPPSNNNNTNKERISPRRARSTLEAPPGSSQSVNIADNNPGNSSTMNNNSNRPTGDESSGVPHNTPFLQNLMRSTSVSQPPTKLSK